MFVLFNSLRRLIPISVILIVLGFILSQPLLGRFVPELFVLLKGGGFRVLSTIAQIGLALFVLGVGMHFDTKAVWKSLGNRGFRSITFWSLVLPGIAGFIFGYFLYEWNPAYAAKASLMQFACATALVFATAAVPVLCAILHSLGPQVLAAYRETIIVAMVGDLILWNALGLLSTDSGFGAIKAVFGLGVIIVIGFTVGMKLLETCEDWVLQLEARGRISERGKHHLFCAFALLTLVLMASATSAVGAHILPGAFLAGMIIPDQMKTTLLYRRTHNGSNEAAHLHPNSVIDGWAKWLMVVFFLKPGLGFEGDLFQPSVWWLGGLFALLATASKMISVFFPAFFIAKLSKKRSLNMSFLLNTRGTMEIVLATELYKLALVSPEVFVAIIIMTIINTGLTVPGVRVVWWRYPEERSALTPIAQEA